ncbi:hypothetical protein VaNZ11_008086 [Volvox africanus]|uniref:Uncharacterized protein n=1 Tax=Volvox africanus TaxID=51714 RepID=A0ABQ5S4A2_9CHLO|nr:hypothetical protein VaNZ11_008086 [Volvox africanus]
MALQAEAAPATGTNAAQPQEDVDWSSVDQVAQMVSRITMGAMQQLWRQHATGMDELGRQYAERMYESHSQTVREIAEVKNFDLRRVLGVLNAFTEVTRELVLGILQEIKHKDDDFTQQLYQTTRGAFSRNLRSALEARDAWYREKLRGLRQRHDAQLAAVRHAAAVELQQRQMQLKIALARTLAKSARGDNPMAILNMLAARTGTELGMHSSGATSAPILSPAGTVGLENASTTSGAAPAGGATGAASTAAGLSPEATAAVRSNVAAMAAVAAAASTMPSGSLGMGDGGNGGGIVAPAELGPEADILEELFEDANAADALNRELEASLARANAELLDLRDKLEAAQTAAQDAALEAAQWRNKWAVEATKTDSLKRESMAIIAKCEEHLTQLQQHHIAEISQRDYLLQRCRDTITNLEARLPAAPSPSLATEIQAARPGMTPEGQAQRANVVMESQRSGALPA